MTFESVEALCRENREHWGFGPEAMKKIRICPSCHAAAPAENTLCPVCGAKLPDETLFQQYRRRHDACCRCGTILTPGMLYCPQCGARRDPGRKVVRPDDSGNGRSDEKNQNIQEGT